MSTIQLRGDTAANWTTVNSLLAPREVGIETDTRRMKIGDGLTPWNSLPYATGETPAATLVTDVAVAAGQPLAINRTTGRFVAADALNYPAAVVVGLAAASASPGHAVDAMLGAFTLADWTAVTGSATLAAGQLYFLAAGGGLTATPPTARGSAVVAVGEAITGTTLRVRPSAPILL